MAENIFGGLDKIGLGMLSGMELYEKEEEKAIKKVQEKEKDEK